MITWVEFFLIQIFENILEKTSLQVHLCFLHTHTNTQTYTYTHTLRITHIHNCVYLDLHIYIRTKPVANGVFENIQWHTQDKKLIVYLKNNRSRYLLLILFFLIHYIGSVPPNSSLPIPPYLLPSIDRSFCPSWPHSCVYFRRNTQMLILAINSLAY